MILPGLIAKSQQFNIWSAACCSGEEPYSIAILLDLFLYEKEHWNINILGSDLNQDFLEKARSSVYKEWSFRETPPEFKRQYFTKNDGQYSLRPDIRKRVKFMELNLVEDPYPVGMNLILCSNVLIYFSEGQIQKVVDKMVAALVDGGHLMCSSIEVPFIKHESLYPEMAGQVTFFRKGESRVQPKLIPIPKALPEEKQVFDKVQEVEALIMEHANQGNLLKAKDLCENAIVENGIKPSLHYLHSVILFELEYFDETVAALKRTLFLDPGFVMAHFTLGTIMLMKNNHTEAKRSIRNTLNLLVHYEKEQILPGTQDMTTERLRFIAESIEVK